MPRASTRTPILLAPVLALTLVALTGAAQGQQHVVDYDIVGPPPTELRRAVAEAALDYLKNLPSVPGSEISDEIVFRSAEKLHLVCVRQLVPGQAPGNAGGGPAYAITAVTIARGLPQQALASHPACDDRTLKYYPFPEMRGTRAGALNRGSVG